MKPIRRRVRSQSNDCAKSNFLFFFSHLAESWRHIAPLGELRLSARRDVEFATRAADALESLLFTVICAKRRCVVIRRQNVRRKVSFAAAADGADVILT
ncbi:MAG: hypothetical protein WAM52_01950 [Steroidobacteraceae bacterium]